MTFQSREIITYKDEEHCMTSLPLDPYLEERGIEFVMDTTSCWRGYHGEWEIVDKALFLIGFVGNTNIGMKAKLFDLFPNKKIVFADWYSGEIRIQVGEVIEYGHFVVTTEKDVILQFKNGIVISEKEIDNHEKIRERKKQQLKLQQEAKNKPPKKPSFWQKLFGK